MYYLMQKNSVQIDKMNQEQPVVSNNGSTTDIIGKTKTDSKQYTVIHKVADPSGFTRRQEYEHSRNSPKSKKAGTIFLI